VILETASESGRIVLPDIADPERFRSAIWGQTSPAAAAARLVEIENLHKRGLLTTDEYLRKREEILGTL
jgi:hypothetical protein